jgi:hypothetical protein
MSSPTEMDIFPSIDRRDGSRLQSIATWPPEPVIFWRTGADIAARAQAAREEANNS